MPIPSPVHELTAPACTSMRWKDWAGYYAVCSFDTCHEREYFAFRHSAGLIDVSPLFKYDIKGSDAAQFLSRIMTKDITKLKDEQVTYCCWCDEQGYVIDDGTVSNLGNNHYRVTSAEPSLAWFAKFQRNLNVSITDVTATIAALSLQGPSSRFILCSLFQNDISVLKFFKSMQVTFQGTPVLITRTGYTGDLGYELFIENQKAGDLYRALLESGKPFSIKACGLDAMDMTRVEAGFILNGVDYYNANHCIIEARKSTPFELNLGWAVQLDRDPFNGQAALQREKLKGPRKRMVGLEIDWMELENEFSRHDLAPEVPAKAWREGKPVYNEGESYIGFATSGTWSPMLKKNLALAHLRPEYAQLGRTVKFEITVEYERKLVKATVVELPFLNLERKRS